LRFVIASEFGQTHRSESQQVACVGDDERATVEPLQRFGVMLGVEGVPGALGKRLAADVTTPLRVEVAL